MIHRNHPQSGYNVGKRYIALVKGVANAMAKELALAARQALPKVPRLSPSALTDLVSRILTSELLDDIANARALVYFSQSLRVEAELIKEYEYFKFFQGYYIRYTIYGQGFWTYTIKKCNVV